MRRLPGGERWSRRKGASAEGVGSKGRMFSLWHTNSTSPEYGNVAEIYHSALTVQFLLSKLEKRGSFEHPNIFQFSLLALLYNTQPSSPFRRPFHAVRAFDVGSYLAHFTVPQNDEKAQCQLFSKSFHSFHSIHPDQHFPPSFMYLRMRPNPFFFIRPTVASFRFHFRRLPWKILDFFPGKSLFVHFFFFGYSTTVFTRVILFPGSLEAKKWKMN